MKIHSSPFTMIVLFYGVFLFDFDLSLAYHTPEQFFRIYYLHIK